MEAILEARDILMVYPNGVVANRGVSLEVEKNTIHAVVGENGAGKSTLMKILFGMQQPQEGEILWKGRRVHLRSSHEAIRLGIGMVHQHLMLAPELSVAENIILGVEPRWGRLFLDTRRAQEITKRVSEEYELEVPPDAKIKDLPIGVRQRVEILKALYRNAQLLILDEPTSVLTPQEAEGFFQTLQELKGHGKTIIFISHKLREVKRIADRVTIMRDARVISTRQVDELSEQEIAYLMVGREIRTERLPPPQTTGPTLLEVRGLSFVNEENLRVLGGVSFDVRAGEIVGLAGVEGNGQTELVRILTGLLQATSGTVMIRGRAVNGLSPRRIRQAGAAHIPEDRMEDGAAAEASVQENMVVDRFYQADFSRGLSLRWKAIWRHALELIERFRILAPSPRTPVASLSGGNIQKVVVARELSSEPEVIIASQPTRGIDVGSEEMVHNLLAEARDRGKAILLASADLDEVLKLSNRILVIYNGELVAHFPDTSGLTGRDLGPYMLGVMKEETASGEVHS